MTIDHPRVPPGYHEGELAVQHEAGVRAEASRLRRMLDPVDLAGGAAHFLADQKLAVLTGRDHDGRLWASLLTGPAGFLEAASADTLRVRSAPLPGDPLHRLEAGQSVGLLVIDFTRRRRLRINGWLAAATSGDEAGLIIAADQAYGNCPQYIQQRDLTCDLNCDVATDAELVETVSTVAAGGTHLTDTTITQVAAADTFFLGTAHPSRGNDSSHRGGPPGFVRVDDGGHLWWPDYPGNNMFNSLGNLAVDPSAALLFCDFATGRTLHLSGTARVERTTRGAVGDDADTGRRVTFTIERTRVGTRASLRASNATGYPRNPAVTT